MSDISKDITTNNISKELNKISGITATIVNSVWMKDMKKVQEVFKPLFDVSKRIRKEMEPVQKVISEITKALEPTLSLIREAKKNPNSNISWYTYYKELSKYYWVYPFGISVEEMKKITNSDLDETKFDKYMEKHFTLDIITKLETATVKMLPENHVDLYRQCIKALTEESYVLANMGLIAIIDDLTSFYLKNKGCTHRYNLFEPIIEEIEQLDLDKFESKHFLLMMVSSNINQLYEDKNFNVKIIIKNHKDINRHTSIHGKYFSNLKSSSLMLANTIYNVLVVNNVFGKYKDSIVRKNKKFVFE